MHRHRRTDLIKEGVCSVLAKWFSFFPFLVLLGCGGDNRVAVLPVSGTITVEGKPAEGAIVTFSVPGQTLISVGKTDATGKFQLTTYRANDGAIEGENVVTVRMSSELPIDPNTAPADPSDTTKILEMSQMMSKMAKDQNLATQRKLNAKQTSALENSLIPVRYSDSQKTDLRAKVEKGKDNKFDFDLKK
jgi:hypothetical protein